MEVNTFVQRKTAYFSTETEIITKYKIYHEKIMFQLIIHRPNVLMDRKTALFERIAQIHTSSWPVRS